jgi:hypothetical protein
MAQPREDDKLKCRTCGRYKDPNELNTKRRCYVHGERNSAQTYREIRNKKGPRFERWKAGMRRAALGDKV